jgi:hypothetical protein
MRLMGRGENFKPARTTRNSRRTTMLRKLTIALAATVALGVVALAPTAASAKFGGGGGWGGGFHRGHFGGIGFGVDYVDDGCYVTQRVLTHYGYRLRTVNVCAY